MLRDDRMRDPGYTAESEEAFERSLSLDVAAGLVRKLPPRPTIWFCSSVRAAKRLDRLLARSAVVVAKTPEHVRNRAYERFNNGELMNLVSVGVLVEGVDLPIASRVVLLRPTSSPTLLSQQCGRGMRPPGSVEIFDFARNFEALGAHPLDDLPWEDVLTGRVPNAKKTVTSPPKLCPTPGCQTLLGSRHNRLCPTCFAEIGRWCVACERSLTGIEDGAHRRCRECASIEREMHRRWAEFNGQEPVIDRVAADDRARAAASGDIDLMSDDPLAFIAELQEQALELDSAAERARADADALQTLVRSLRHRINAQLPPVEHTDIGSGDVAVAQVA